MEELHKMQNEDKAEEDPVEAENKRNIWKMNNKMKIDNDKRKENTEMIDTVLIP
jgi:hypothetical protein